MHVKVNVSYATCFFVVEEHLVKCESCGSNLKLFSTKVIAFFLPGDMIVVATHISIGLIKTVLTDP
jgi:hypothetical protein